MYLRKVQGPRAVTLAGRHGDDARRSAARRHQPLGRQSQGRGGARAWRSGLIARAEALERYALTDEEFDGWCTAVARHGERALQGHQIAAASDNCRLQFPVDIVW